MSKPRVKLIQITHESLILPKEKYMYVGVVTIFWKETGDQICNKILRINSKCYEFYWTQVFTDPTSKLVETSGVVNTIDYIISRIISYINVDQCWVMPFKICNHIA